MKKNKILIIEDSFIVSELLKHTLSRVNEAEINICSSAFNMAHEENDYDLIVLDHYLDKSKGVQLTGLDMLKQHKIWIHNTPVIVFSGQKNMDIALQYINEGAIDYVSKDDNDFIDNLSQSIDSILKAANNKSDFEEIKQTSREKISKTMQVLVPTIVLYLSLI